MAYFLLIFSVFFSASSGIFGKLFNRQNEGNHGGQTFYNFLNLTSICIGWGILFLFDPSFDVGVLRFSALFGISFAFTFWGLISALECGPTTLTSLFLSLSLILATVWGLFFWGAEFNSFILIGLVLVIIAIVLCLYDGKKAEKSISLKWIFYIVLVFLANATCTIIQRTQQMKYDGKYGTMMMFFATLISALVFAFVFFKSDKRDVGVMMKKSGWIPIFAGVCNVALNLFIIILATSTLSPSLIYPVVSIGNLAVVTLFSLFMFKERMRWWQWLGMAVGAVAVGLLSL